MLLRVNISSGGPGDTRAHPSQSEVVCWVWDQRMLGCSLFPVEVAGAEKQLQALSYVEQGLQPGETCLPHTATIPSTTQPGNGGIWLRHSPVFKTGKIRSDSGHQLFRLQSGEKSGGKLLHGPSQTCLPLSLLQHTCAPKFSKDENCTS